MARITSGLLKYGLPTDLITISLRRPVRTSTEFKPTMGVVVATMTLQVHPNRPAHQHLLCKGPSLALTKLAGLKALLIVESHFAVRFAQF
jgi:hypothetical protein